MRSPLAVFFSVPCALAMRVVAYREKISGYSFVLPKAVYLGLKSERGFDAVGFGGKL